MADHSLTRPAQLRFFLLALALVLLAALTAIAAWIAAREFRTLRRQFDKVQMESFRIADELISSVARLNSSLFAFEASGEDQDRQNFERDSRLAPITIRASFSCWGTCGRPNAKNRERKT